MNNKNCLVIFCKNPDTQKVKTRLAKEIGKEKAVEIYKKILDEIITKNKNSDYDLILYIKGDENYFSKYNLLTKQQVEGDLGKKMLTCFEDELKNYDKVVIVGSDMPEIDTKMIDNVFKKLDEFKLVFGPAYDGGYYLIAQKKPLDVFIDKWSHANGMRQTLDIALNKKYKFYLLEEKRDIDTKNDLEYYDEFNY